MQPISTATAIGVKLRPEVLRKWQKEAEERYHLQLEKEAKSPTSTYQNPTRQMIDEKHGIPVVQTLLQRDIYFPEETRPVPKFKKKIVENIIKRNKALIQSYKMNPFGRLRASIEQARASRKQAKRQPPAPRQSESAKKPMTPTSSIPPTPLSVSSEVRQQLSNKLPSSEPALLKALGEFSTSRPKARKSLPTPTAASNAHPGKSAGPDILDLSELEIADQKPPAASVGSALQHARSKAKATVDESTARKDSFDMYRAIHLQQASRPVLRIAEHSERSSAKQLRADKNAVDQRSPIYFLKT